MTSNKQKLGNEYRIEALYTLARLGYATTRQIAAAVWWRCDTSTRKMAGRTLRWLLSRGYIVERREDDTAAGERMTALTKAGAQWLAQQGEPLPGGKAHARDWLRHAHSHRTACNSVYAAVAAQAQTINVGYSELEIRNGVAPGHLAGFSYRMADQVQRKIPDLVLLSGLIGCPQGTAWVEVENTWRSAKDLEKLIAFMRALFSQPAPQVDFVWVVITVPGAASIGKRIRQALTHAENDFSLHRKLRELDARILARRVFLARLDPNTLQLTPMAW